MKTLVGVAVYGLVPVPPMPDTVSSGFDGRWTTSEHDLDLSQLVFSPHPVAERMVTKDELARIRYELEEIAAKKSRHSGFGDPAISIAVIAQIINHVGQFQRPTFEPGFNLMFLRPGAGNIQTDVPAAAQAWACWRRGSCLTAS